ncbi:MAG: hypothetical protein GDA37_02965 [Ekhidna sp.]|nr:hypothetical protein [Ekhidna sp.]
MRNSTPTRWLLWSDGTTIWVVDFNDEKLYAYTLATGARDVAKEVDLAADNDRPIGLWSDGTTTWVADEGDKIYAYTLATKTRDAGKDINTLTATGNDSPRGLWSDGTTIWVADGGDDKLYAYAIQITTPAPTPVPASEPSLGARLPVRDIDALTTAGNDSPYGLWSDGTTIWVVDDGLSDAKLYAYTLATSTRDAGKEFDLVAGNDSPRGLWSDGTTIWVANSGFGDEKLYAYTLAKTVVLVMRNSTPTRWLPGHVMPPRSLTLLRAMTTLMASGRTALPYG